MIHTTFATLLDTHTLPHILTQFTTLRLLHITLFTHFTPHYSHNPTALRTHFTPLFTCFTPQSSQNKHRTSHTLGAIIRSTFQTTLSSHFTSISSQHFTPHSPCTSLVIHSAQQFTKPISIPLSV